MTYVTPKYVEAGASDRFAAPCDPAVTLRRWPGWGRAGMPAPWRGDRGMGGVSRGGKLLRVVGCAVVLACPVVTHAALVTGRGLPVVAVLAAGQVAALAAVVKGGTDRTVGLDASTVTYNKALSVVADAKLKIAEQTEQVRARLTRQFATMDARTAAYKSTQSFLDNQIKAWNRSDA